MSRKLRKIMSEPPDERALFGIPLADGRWRAAYLEQWYVRDGKKHTPLIVLLDKCDKHVANLENIDDAHPIAMAFTLGIALMYGAWPIIGSTDRKLLAAAVKMREAISRDFIGVKVQNESIVEDLSNAIEGLCPWNKYKDKDYFDKLLIPGQKRPSRAVYL